MVIYLNRSRENSRQLLYAIFMQFQIFMNTIKENVVQAGITLN